MKSLEVAMLVVTGQCCLEQRGMMYDVDDNQLSNALDSNNAQIREFETRGLLRGTKSDAEAQS